EDVAYYVARYTHNHSDPAYPEPGPYTGQRVRPAVRADEPYGQQCIKCYIHLCFQIWHTRSSVLAGNSGWAIPIRGMRHIPFYSKRLSQEVRRARCLVRIGCTTALGGLLHD